MATNIHLDHSTPKFLDTFININFFLSKFSRWIIFAWKSMPYGRPLQSSSLFGRYSTNRIYFICYQSYALVECHSDNTEEWVDFHCLGSMWVPISYIIKNRAYETITISYNILKRLVRWKSYNKKFSLLVSSWSLSKSSLQEKEARVDGILLLIFWEKKIHTIFKTSNVPYRGFPTMLHALKLVELVSWDWDLSFIFYGG